MAAGTTRESKTILTAEDKTGGAFSSFQKNVNDAKGKVESLHAGLVGLAGTLAVGGFALMIKSAVDATARMKDLGQEAGVTAAAISRFEAPARMAGLGLDTVASAMFKLSKAALEAKDPTSKAAQALGAIGLSTEKLKGLKPDEMFELIARSITGYSNGLEKNAVMQELFGKSGREMNRVLAEVAEKGKLVATVTDEEADAADRLGDQMIELQMQSEKAWRSIIAEGLPTLNEMLRLFIDAKKEGGLLAGIIASVSGAFDKMGGSDADKLKRINDQIALAIENDKNRSSFFGIQSGQAYDMNGLLERRAALEKRIFDQELEAQNKRALAALGDSGKKINYDPAAAAAALAEAKRREAEAIRDAKKALDDYVRGALDALKMDEDLAKEIAALTKKRDGAVLAAEKNIANIEFETTLIGMSNVERETAIALRALETSGITKQDSAYAALAERMTAAIAAQQQAIENQKQLAQQTQIWDSLATSAGNFFGDLVMNGKSAFDSLKQSLKSFAAEIIAFFAKRYVLQMIAGASGTFGATAANAASSALGGMGNSLLGTGLSAAGSYLFGTAGTAAGAYAATGMPMAAYAIGQGTVTGATAGAIGSGGLMSSLGAFAASPVGIAVIAGLAIAAVAKIFDKGDATRTGSFGNPGSQDPGAKRWNSALGTSAFFNTHWFGDDQAAGINTFMGGLTGLDNAIGGRLDPATLAKVQGSLVNRDYSFGKEHTGDDAQAFGQILKDRVHDIFGAISPELQKLTDAFTGTGEELGNFALSLIDIKNAVDNGIVPGLTLDGLLAAQQAGEGLGDTLNRLKQVFDDAAAATAAAAAAQLQMITDLNAAIGARNPTFARGTTLTARNSIATQFGALVGQSFGDALLEQMALRPETFTGLSTEAGNLLVQFLGLQTTLEGLDEQLGIYANATVNSFATVSSAVDATATAFIDSANALMGARSGLANYLRGTLLSNLSPLTPGQQYAESRSQYNRMLGLARTGDIDALNGLGSARDTFLTNSRAVNASSGQYNTDFFGSFDQVNAVSGFQVSRPFTNIDAAAQTAQLIAQLQANGQNTQQTNVLIGGLIALLNSGLTVNDPAVQSVLTDIGLSLGRSGGGALTSGGSYDQQRGNGANLPVTRDYSLP